MSVNYDRVCRLCLSSRGELLPIFPTTSSDDTEPYVLASKIKDCVAVQINENDNLPTNVCRKCMDNVNNWHIFKTVCEKTQNKLLSLIEKDGSLLEEVKIKSEPLSDEAYDEVAIDGSYPDVENAGPASKLQPEGPPILASLGLTPKSDKKYVDPRKDWQRAHAILDMVQDSDAIDSLGSVEEHDNVYHSDHESESESELLTNIDSTYTDWNDGYLCRNNKVISDHPINDSLESNSSTAKKRKILHTNFDLPKNAWQALITDDLLEHIVVCTNNNIVKNRTASLVTNVAEIKTVIGVLYLHGILRPTYENISTLWDSNLGVSCVGRYITLDRFNFILENIKFDNDDDIEEEDPLRRMRTVFEMFAMNCRKALKVGDEVVVDEVIVPVYGPCPLRYNIDKKPLKQGIKLVLLVDPHTFYVSNLDVVSKLLDPQEIVEKVTQHLKKSGKTIIMDSWYFSMPLMYSLKNSNLYTNAALHPQSGDVPPIFFSEYRKDHQFLTGYSNNYSITSYINSENKVTNVITNDPKYSRKGLNMKFSSVSVYKKNQSAVEVLDVLMHYYTTMQCTNNWTLSLFFTMLNIAAVNGQVLKNSFSSNIIPRRLYIRELALSLIGSKEVTVEVLSEVKKKMTILPNEKRQRTRCKVCCRKRNRKTTRYCYKCDLPICLEHTVPICTNCVQN